MGAFHGFADESSHNHHVAIAGGAAWHDSKTSGFVGIDYIYVFKNKWGLGVFYEEALRIASFGQQRNVV